MREILLSADGDISLYLVPDEAAENLREYCLEFCEWLHKSPDAKQFYFKTGKKSYVYYPEEAFIEYLNKYVFDERSRYIKTLKRIRSDYSLPKKYKDLPYFNF